MFVTCLAAAQSVTVRCKLMGVACSFTAVHPDTITARAGIESAIAEVERIENLISEWKPDSETSLINRNAGHEPVKVSRELFDLISRSLKVSVLTHGAFDITFRGAYDLWTFDKAEHKLPDSSEVASSVLAVGNRKLIVDVEASSVFLLEPAMRIGFGGIGKGYAANRAKQVMTGFGIKNGLVNMGGDLLAWGRDENDLPWKVAIADPEVHERVIAWLEADDMAVVTSGDYEKYFVSEGVRYAHIVDPRTGWPAHGLKSVTVLCPDAELADALATAVFVLGKTIGLDLINALDGIECLIVDEDNEVVLSNNLNLNR